MDAVSVAPSLCVGMRKGDACYLAGEEFTVLAPVTT